MAVDVHAAAWAKEGETPAAGDPSCRVRGPDLLTAVRLGESLRESDWAERSRWLDARLRRRAFLVAKSLPVLPGQTVLELGAGSGVWTEHLALALAGQNPITAVVFNEDLTRIAQAKCLPNAKFVHIGNAESAFPPESFDYVVSSGALADDVLPAILELVYRWLRPGGQFVFFVRNPANPIAYCRRALNLLSHRSERVGSGRGVNLKLVRNVALQRGFQCIEAVPSEVIPPLRSLLGQAIWLILEQSPLTRCFSCVVSVQGGKPGGALGEERPQVGLAVHRQLFGAVSVVVPCHNEEANINRLVKSLLGMYGNYLREIVIVDDNSTDKTSEVAAALSAIEPRVKLVKRNPPSGVGRALRDGYAAASGKYILTIDCDFITIAAEFKGLFDAVAEGYDGAIGSRFSSESALIRYPLSKTLCNRGYHLLMNLLLGKRVRDISNNLKLYRAEILKSLDIEEDRFAANVETGLKPILLNYRIREVPTSWINRTPEMGKSSFSLLKAGPDYLGVLFRATWRYWRGQYHNSH